MALSSTAKTSVYGSLPSQLPEQEKLVASRCPFSVFQYHVLLDHIGNKRVCSAITCSRWKHRADGRRAELIWALPVSSSTVRDCRTRACAGQCTVVTHHLTASPVDPISSFLQWVALCSLFSKGSPGSCGAASSHDTSCFHSHHAAANWFLFPLFNKKMQFISQRRKFVKKETVPKSDSVSESKISICSSKLPVGEWYPEEEKQAAVWKESRIQTKCFRVS